MRHTGLFSCRVVIRKPAVPVADKSGRSNSAMRPNSFPPFEIAAVSQQVVRKGAHQHGNLVFHVARLEGGNRGQDLRMQCIATYSRAIYHLQQVGYGKNQTHQYAKRAQQHQVQQQ